MKIHQLPIGARFEYEGDEYVKSGPMIATGKTGQRMIPKYAVLKPLDRASPAPETRPAGTVSRTEAVDAFQAFFAQCATLVPDDSRDEMEAARMAFLTRLSSPRS